MPAIKISSMVEQKEWRELQKIARESHQSISDFVRKRRLRPIVLDHLEDSMNENEELGERLAE